MVCLPGHMKGEAEYEYPGIPKPGKDRKPPAQRLAQGRRSGAEYQCKALCRMNQADEAVGELAPATNASRRIW